jgi:hypothetical protein
VKLSEQKDHGIVVFAIDALKDLTTIALGSITVSDLETITIL